MKARLAILALTAMLGACAVGPNFRPPAPPAAPDYGSAPIQGEFAAGEGSAAKPQRLVADMDIPGQWWQLFQSDPLDRLIEQALRGNPDLQAAQAALRQARELYAAQRATLLPGLQGQFAATRVKNAVGTIANPTSLPQSSPYYNLYTAQLSVSYVPDIFGGTRRAIEGSHAQSESARFQMEATYVTLTSNVVVTAVQEASLRGQIAATERLVELQRQLTATVRQQQGLGTASELDRLTQQTAADQIAASLPPLRKQLGLTRDALTALLGKLPSEEPAETFRLEELTLPGELPVSLPSKLVAQRPDVRAAEANLHAASAQVGVTLAAMLPQFNITADTGSAALVIHQLFKPYTGFWDAGASLSQTLFDAGALLHRKRAAEAALDEAGAQYRAVVIQSCQNVADALRALQSDAEALQVDSDAESAARRLFDMARQQRTLGTLSAVALLNAEQAYQQTELTFIQAQANRFADTAALFQALGGGWWNQPESST